MSMKRIACPGLSLAFAIAFVNLPVASFSDPPTHPRPVADAVTPSSAKPSSVRVAGIVLKWLRGDKEANYRRIEPLIREAAAHGAQIVCTTECFLDGYAIADKSIPLAQYRALGELIPEGIYFRKLASLAKELKIFLIAGMLEADGEQRYNTAALISPSGELVGKYHKQQLEHEAVRNTAGKESPLFETPFGKLGVMICADRRFSDVVKVFCERGADFLLCPSGGMFGPKSNDPILQARSKENGKYIVFVHPAEFLVTGPDGTILERTILGDRLLIVPDQRGTAVDSQRVCYFDVPLAHPLAGLCLPLLMAWALPGAATDQVADWMEPMQQVHARFTGNRGTLALFGDSITVSLAFWAPLEGEPKAMSSDMARAHRIVKAYMKPECWRQWRGPAFGNEGRMTIRWAHANADRWLQKLNPEAAVIMFGSNDVGEMEVAEYEQKTREVVRCCLTNGTVVLLTTPPPRSGRLDKSKQFAEAVRKVAREERVPLIDYFAAILERRPDDWDGALPQFKQTPGDEYQVPTLIARDGVHPSNPRQFNDFSDASLRQNGFTLRNYLTLLGYAAVIENVFQARAS